MLLFLLIMVIGPFPALISVPALHLVAGKISALRKGLDPNNPPPRLPLLLPPLPLQKLFYNLLFIAFSKFKGLS